ncbi:MAG TPA: ribonuclease M5 [Virgibacillus sp.]|nr:ribonuclease M5 [Virgibacillus sp.]
MKIKEVIVVEGKDDSAKVKQAVDADTIETNGSAINENTLAQIKHAQEKRGVIIFTDPDYPGTRIRHIINDAVPGCKHAFLTRDQAQSKKAHASLGIEHASIQTIREALEAVYDVMENEEINDITKADLISYGLIGSSGAQRRRERLGELLRIGHTNGKQLLKRLTMFQITNEQFVQAMSQIKQEENNES